MRFPRVGGLGGGNGDARKRGSGGPPPPQQAHLFYGGKAGELRFDGLRTLSLGEAYGRSMMHDFNSGAEGWTDWNILLDEMGGPNHVGNYCFAPIHADTRTGTLIYTNSYYYIGHFSQFIRPGARRIVVAASRSMLPATGFVNPDGGVAGGVMNPAGRGGQYHLRVGSADLTVRSPAHSIQTTVF